MELRISSPCPMAWEELVGSDRVRYCGKCQLNVYNLADMSSPDIEDLLRRTEGRLCGRLYLRGDRTASVRNCPGSARKRRISGGLLVAAILGLAAFAGIFRALPRPDRRGLPSWVRGVVDLIDPEPPTPRSYGVVGKLCPPPSFPSGPSPQTPGANAGSGGAPKAGP